MIAINEIGNNILTMKENIIIHPIRYTFGRNLRKIRRLKDISQETLAFESEISRAYISDIERGQRAVSIDVMGRLADALGVNIVTLLRADYSVDELLADKV